MKVLQDIILQAKLIPRALCLAVLLAIAYLFIKENGARAKSKLRDLLRQRWLTAFIIYTAFILTSTLAARVNTKPYVRIFDSFGFRGDPKWDAEIIENILLFVPFAFFYIMAFHPSMPWKAALKLSALTSVGIEICQLIFWLGSFQLADFVHNVLGGMIGCGIWYLARWIKMKRHERKDTEDPDEGEKEITEASDEQL